MPRNGKPGTQGHFHQWASENGFYLNNAEDLDIATERYEEHYDVAEEDLDDFWSEDDELVAEVW